MKIITKEKIIKGVAKRYKYQYKDEMDLIPKFSCHNLTNRQIYLLLLEAKTEKDVDEAIGVEGWARNCCDECGEDVFVSIMLGGVFDVNESNLCSNCLSTAITLCDNENSGK